MNIWIYGGCILDSILNLRSKDHDIIIECKNKEEIKKLKQTLEEKFDFDKNSFGGYKIYFKEEIIDIDFVLNLKNDYSKFIEINSDGFFYNLSNPKESIITDGFLEYIESGNVYIVNKESIHPNKLNRREERINNAINKYKRIGRTINDIGTI